MDDDLDAALDAEAYAALVEDLASTASAPDVDAWDAVGEVVPELTEPVCERVVEHAANDPDESTVEEVAAVRNSDAAERLRARAVTALVADVRERVDADG